ncbi:FAD-binding and (Fe-S)-binding domain-containing protein [Candidatus Albibeggiatoa sp. nov. BB20]|uniref:FAD-binding and (Fe-S)-binding domain-containing protein n=1 Tax=Candidatus Albibeggiatoa sp. nov. BB20 TaxID=3162723 RepID=UPI0033655BCD
MLSSTHEKLQKSLLSHIPQNQIISDPLRTLAYGTDASFYRLQPQLVVKVKNEQEVIHLLRMAQNHKTPVTFRAAGTSLSGQAISDSVLAVLSGEAWNNYQIHENGHQITLQTGIIGAQANTYLLSYGRKIGPDPASINAAKIGGIAANNASGMCCGTAQNSYNTLAGMRIIFADGTVLDTRDKNSITAFDHSHSEFLQSIQHLAHTVQHYTELKSKIQHKYRLKNTTGYGLNALIDYTDPIDIIQHLMIGSEGTLGFISEITYHTVPDPAHKATALVLFPNIEQACQTVAKLAATPVTAVELMDRPALRSVQGQAGIPSELSELDDEMAALLIDVRAEQDDILQQQVDEVQAVLNQCNLLKNAHFTTNTAEYAKLWNIRKGLFPAVGAVREVGTTVIIEDVAFPLPMLAKAVRELQHLFKKYHYNEAIIFGHALAGNLHFVFTQDFGTTEEVQRYKLFMDEVCQMVTGEYQGSLKAEHGTGRNMSPFVKLEWGEQAYDVMQQLKNLFDPKDLLNPGVILNPDDKAHIKDLKPLPPADSIIDRCIECGFCEPICPSRDLTLTPRQRITIWREIARLERTQENPSRLKQLQKDFDYQGIETCAIDGLCATQCPVNINTGDLTVQLRQQKRGKIANVTGNWIESHFSTVALMTRFSLGGASLAQSVLGNKLMSSLSQGARDLSGKRLPLWTAEMPRPTCFKPVQQTKQKQKVVYFAACATRVMGASQGHDELPLPQEIVTLLNKAQIEVIYVQNPDSHCCGQPYESKGLAKQADKSLTRLADAVYEASEDGKIAAICDTSPCSLRLKQALDDKLKVYEITEYLQQEVIPKLELKQQVDCVSLHITCSARKMGLESVLLEVAKTCAKEVILPEEAGCCGFAGDKGFTQPELNASALQHLKSALPKNCEGGYSNSRTCEIGLSLHSGVHYNSLVYLVNQCFK